MKKVPTYIWRSRHGVFYFRYVSPRSTGLPGERKLEAKCSLNTRDPREAVDRARVVWGRVFKLLPSPRHSRHPEDHLFETNEAGAPDTPSSCLRRALRRLAMEFRAGHDVPAEEQTHPVLASEVVGRYSEERRTAGLWRIKTDAENQAIYSTFIRIVGDVPFPSLNRHRLAYYKETLRRLPANLNKSPHYRGKSIAQVTAMTDVTPMSLTTVNKYLSRVHALFEFGVTHGYIAQNPVTGLLVRTNNRHQREQRDAFSEADLQKLLDGSIYKGERRAEPHHFFLPLLGMYTGARLEELAQLHTEDIVEREGIPCLMITDDGDRKLKNRASVRCIPIHPRLVRYRFLGYVELMRRSSAPRLFMGLQKRRDGYGQSFSKFFAGYRKACGIDSGKKCFHSLRHTVASHLQRKGLPAEQVAALLGHSLKSITYDRYGKGFSAQKLAEVVAQLDYSLGDAHVIALADHRYRCPL